VATSTGPYAVTLGTVLQLAPAQASGVYFSSVQIVNSTPFLATVMVGGNQFLLQPFMADIYVVPTGGQVIPVTFSQPPGGTTTPGVTGSFCTATWYRPADQITDSYPIALTAAAVTAAISSISINPSPVTNLPFADTPLVSWATGPIYFGGTTTINLKILELAWEISSAANYTVNGYFEVLVGSPLLGTLLVDMWPTPATFVAGKGSLSLPIPTGGITIPGFGIGTLYLYASFSPEPISAVISGHMSAFAGY
jgi:hypothetical protein